MRPAILILFLALSALAPAVDSDPEPLSFPPGVASFPDLQTAFRAAINPGAPPPEGLIGDCAAELRASGQGTPSPLGAEEADALREAALAALADPTRLWGAEPFLIAAAQPARFAGEEALPRYLVEQLRDDDVRGNALASAEFIIIGLQHDPNRFLPALLDEATKLPSKPGAELPQGPLMAAHLALLWAADEQQAFASRPSSWWALARADHRPEGCGNLLVATPQQRRQLFDVAERLVWRETSWRTPRDLNVCAFGARRCAWAMFECGPLEEDRLARIATADDRHETFASRRALSIWLLRDPESLARDEAITTAVEAVRKSPWASWSELRAIFQPEPEFAADAEWFAGHWDWLHGPALKSPSPRQLAQVRAEAPAFKEAFRDALADEADAHVQLAFCRLLLAWEDADAEPLVAQVLVSHFADDDVTGNAVDAQYLLGRMRSPAAIDAARAALNVGASTGDWQLIDRSARHLLLFDESFDPAAHPAAIEAMVAHLFDDEIAGNAAAARRFLLSCGDAARPALEQALASGDEQARRYAGSVLHRLEPDQGASRTSAPSIQR